MSERLSIQQVGDRFGWDRRYTVDYLQQLHEKHGGLLFRRHGRRTKLWVDAAQLTRLMQDRLGVAPTAADIALIHNRIDRAEALAERSMRELSEFRRKARQWFKRHNPDNS